MVDPLVLLAFVPAALALNLTPGADMMFCLGQGLRSGARPAIAASAGISTGSMVHVTLAGLGLGATVAAMPWLFDVIRWVGVAYLLWLALGAIRGAAAPAQAVTILPARAFRTGLIVNLTNPKVILFVLAFIPQFVVPEAGPIVMQFLIFGSVLAVGGLVINALIGIFAGGVGHRLTGSPGLARGLGYVTGGIFTALALRLAMMERA
jgi:threonine/homoserine/homoserine lactone efflux protein